jgi:NTE family protein
MLRSRPDILVLGAGGVLGEAWMIGVLAGIEDATGFDLRRCEYFVGTSAGSIIAARLVAGESPQRPRTPGTAIESATQPHTEGLTAIALHAARYAGELTLLASAPFVSAALAATARGGALARATVLRRLPRPTRTLTTLRNEVDRSGARFDGRLRIVAVDRRSGRRAVFGSPRGPKASVAKAVEASCAVPWLFAPVAIDGHEYVDGGVWSPTNLDAAPAGRDTHVLCLIPTAAMTGSSALVGIGRNVTRSAVALEALALRRRGAAVQTVAPDAESAAAMGMDFMDHRPREHVLAAGYGQGRRLAAARNDRNDATAP